MDGKWRYGTAPGTWPDGNRHEEGPTKPGTEDAKPHQGKHGRAAQRCGQVEGARSRVHPGSFRKMVVRLAGIEPTTLGFGGQYSIH